MNDQSKIRFFDRRNVYNLSNKRLIGIKENIIQLLKELVKDQIIHNRLEIILKNGKKKMFR